ncbi:uncharacterized protein LOC107619914 [Arachis ipaensis]|uniref:uncharacterized protein LOC107619914 n=1 Tax=Arachis ipaensis TaxID=130454 RepID=UPI0007AF97C8|nr:uncharacterized protein LOC107619914 [Arachis ipaensis]XP_025682271.1 uncharacterized protein LOC112783512 [Arachis hypogaea]
MTWISPLKAFGVRELLSMESMFKSHREACLVIVSKSMDSDTGTQILNPFVKKGFRVTASAPDFKYIFKGTHAKSWFQKLKEGNVNPGEVFLGQNLSNLLRLALLYKFGGAYIEADVVVLKIFSKLRNTIGALNLDPRTGEWSRLNNAVLVLPPPCSRGNRGIFTESSLADVVKQTPDMADNGVHQLTQSELMAQMAELQAEVKRLAELSAQNNTNKRDEGNPKRSSQGMADLLIDDPPKERLTLDNPFSEEITNFQMPKHFTLPSSLEPYKGIGDPRAHIKKFQSMMFFNGPNNEPVLCRAFPTYLDGAALLWFSKLPAGSISSFEELAKSFIDYFAAARIYVHGSDYLGTIHQGPQESLKDYLTRFAEATMEIPDLDPAVHLHALKAGLRPGKFRETIAITKPKTLEEFRERAAGQMEIEELREANKTKRKPRREEDRTPRSAHNKDFGKPFKLTPKFDNYTRFNTRREKIIKEILNAKIIKPPTRAGSYQDQRFVDKSKHCAFHQKYGHTTDECIIAKDLLERLARQGLLDKYIEGRKHKEGDHDKEERQPTSANKETNKWPSSNQPKAVINCISGGFAGGGETTSARKRSYRAMLAIEGTAPLRNHDAPDLEITFNKADICSAAPHLDDPVVISIQTGDLLVRKVLLDPGSSADVLFYSTFLKMNLSEKLIQPSSGELVGFSGERVPIKGYIWLKTTIGGNSSFRTLDIQYLIVDCISPYNIILGRPALNMFRAVISTFHLCVKFQAQDGRITTIHSDRQQARQCYNSSLKRLDKREKQHEVKAVQTREEVLSLAELDPRGDAQERPQPSDEL